MTTPNAMTEISDSRHQLHAAFMTMAKRSFELCEQARRNMDFYEAVLRKLDRGESIGDEVPEAKGMMPDALRLTVQRLHKLNRVRADQAWELPENLQSCFLTVVRSRLPKGELIPQYVVEYVGQADAKAKIKVKTMRRNLKVDVTGSDEKLEDLWIQMSYAAMLVN